jgi:4a-hydroxytetrahydrobiopterin dehydratase
MPDRPELLSSQALTDGLTTMTGWTGDTSGIERTVECASFPAAIELVRQVAEVAESLDHHPDIDIRWRKVRFAVVTHSAGGVTDLDLSLARRIDELAG